MHSAIPAIYEDGVFRPLKKLRLKEHKIIFLKLKDSEESYASLLETIEILSDNAQVKRIAHALHNVKRGRILSHEDVFGHPQPNL